jgi:hypothetical protein
MFLFPRKGYPEMSKKSELVQEVKSKKSELVQEVRRIRSQDDSEEAEQHFFDVIERYEKKIINIAKTLVQDEVDTLFGRDHGNSIHNDPCDKPPSRGKQARVWHL